MWRPVLAMLALSGCAQIFGLEETSSAIPDARPDAAPDAQPCVGGDARAVDPVSGHCYMFFSTPMIRDAARTVCQGFGPTSRLASIQSVAESTLIAGLIGTSVAFIGASDELTENTFVWEDGTPVLLTNWNTAEPNNAVGQFEEDCVVMIGTLGGVWNDVPCAPSALSNLGTYPFVCERD